MKSFLIVAFVATCGFGATWFNVSNRRRFSRAEIQDLLPDNVFLVERLSDEDRALSKQAFLSSPDWQWIAGYNPLKDETNETLRSLYIEINNYMVECTIRFAEHYGYVLVQRDDSGDYLGSITFLPPFESWRLLDIQYELSVKDVEQPLSLKVAGLVADRYDALDDNSDVSIQNFMKTTNFWYIHHLAVNVKHQGKGIGKNLVSVVKNIVKNSPWHRLCLECHNGNVPFYEKLGFYLADRYYLTTAQEGARNSFQYNLMVYPQDIS